MRHRTFARRRSPTPSACSSTSTRSRGLHRGRTASRFSSPATSGSSLRTLATYGTAGRRFTSQSEGIVCRGKALTDGTVAWWKVRVWADQSERSAYSAPARIDVPQTAAASPQRRPTHASDGQLEFVDGRLGRALRFGPDRPKLRADDYDALRSTKGTTISAWIRPRRITNTWQCIYRKEDGNDRRLLAIGEEGPFWGLWCGFSIGGRYVESGAPIDKSRLSDGAWHHVAATFDGRSIRLFLDGDKLIERDQPGAIGSGGTAPAYIGSFGGNAEVFDGDIDDLRVYTRALTNVEVLRLIAGERDIANEALAALWTFDDTIANEATFTPERRQHRIAIVGGSLVAEMDEHAFFETAVTTRWPHHDITFRNLGWPADDVFGTARGEFESATGPGTWRPRGGDPGVGYGQLLGQVRAAEPTTLIVAYGAEAAYTETAEQMRHFEEGYARLVREFEQTGAKLILVTPIPQGKAAELDAEIDARNTRLKRAAAFIVQLAAERKHASIDLNTLFSANATHYRTAIALSEAGYRHVATLLTDALGVNAKTELSTRVASVRGEGLQADDIRPTPYGTRFSLTLDQLPSVACNVALGGDQGLYYGGELVGHASEKRGARVVGRGPDVEQADELRRLIIRKNSYHRAKLRPLNKTYIFLFRSYEMGHFAVERNEYDDLIEGVEEQIALLRVPRTHRYEFRPARGWTAPRSYPDHEVPKNIPSPNVEEELASFTVAEGFQVNLFAKNPMVANPINLNWDVHGRAWVSTSSTYPHPRPGERPNDRIVILEDRDRDGVADNSKVFAQGLLVPHSVLPVPGGAYVCSATKLLFLSDADGDAVSESRRVVFSGFGNAGRASHDPRDCAGRRGEICTSCSRSTSTPSSIRCTARGA